ASYWDLCFHDFVRAADALAPVLGNAPTRPLGETILAAVEATTALVPTNANLGTILLLAPLAPAACPAVRLGCRARPASTTVEPAVIECHFTWLAEFPDSLIARKNGPAVAEDARQRVRHVLSLGGLDTAEGRAAGVELDRYLRSDGNKLNPGTSADLVAACLF